MKAYVAGHNGMVGSAIVKKFQQYDTEVITRNREQLDLCNQSKVEELFTSIRPDVVIIAAAKVGGIHANSTYPAEFIYENLAIQTNIIHAAFKAGIHRLIFMGSSCIYPSHCAQPMKEEFLLTGPLEPTNEPYAVAKIAGLKMVEAYSRQYGVDYRSLMPTNLYGPGDNFDLDNAHVLPALMRKFHTATANRQVNVSIWGSGAPKREFLHVDDCADAVHYIMNVKEAEFAEVCSVPNSPDLRFRHINVGTGKDCSIEQLALQLKRETQFQGELAFDLSKPDGTPRKLMDVDRLSRLGWSHQISLDEGIESTYQWFLSNKYRGQ